MWLITIFVLNVTVFMIISEMFHGRISLNSVLLLLHPIINIRSSFTDLHDFQLLVLLPQFIEILFHLHQQNRSSESEVKVRHASNHTKKILEAAKLAYGNKMKDSITSQKPGSWDFWQITNSVLNKCKSAILLLFNGPEVLSSASDKAKLFAENFSKNSNLDDSGISLPVFPSRTNLKLHNISVALKMVKKVITNLDLPKASSPNCIPVVVLKNCRPELSYILSELFNNCLKESCFPDCWKVSLVVPVFKNVGEGLQLKTTTLLVLFLWLIKSLENL